MTPSYCSDLIFFRAKAFTASTRWMGTRTDFVTHPYWPLPFGRPAPVGLVAVLLVAFLAAFGAAFAVVFFTAFLTIRLAAFLTDFFGIVSLGKNGTGNTVK